MAKVYIVNNMVHDYSSAAKFGELVNATEGKVPIFKTDISSEWLERTLKDFTEEDYLLLSGPTILCIMAHIIVVRALKDKRQPTVIKFLVFDAKEQSYIVRHLSA